MTFVTDIRSEIRHLSERLAGVVLTSGDRGWDSARQAWNLAVDQRPAAVVIADGVDDVAATVQLARDTGMKVAAQGTGHGAGTLGSLEDVILLKTIRVAELTIDPGKRSAPPRARVGAGVLWGDVAIEAGRHGLAGLAGSAADVGVVGYTLGGGIGWLSRRYGLACNSVSAVELVNADGELIRADRDNEAELFWALRGGGGGLGVLTALEFELYPVSHAYAGIAMWPLASAAEVLTRYLELTQSAPTELTAGFRFLHLPPVPAVPEFLRGQRVVAVDAAFLGGPERGTEVLRPLKALATPLIDTFATIPAAELSKVHGDPDQPVPGMGDGFLIGELDQAAADVLLSLGGPDADNPLLALELRHLGGALASAPAEHGALAKLDADFTVYGVGMPINPTAAQAIEKRLDVVAEAMAPWRSDVTYLNFADRAETRTLALGQDVRTRLTEIRRSNDPEGMFHVA